jgi:hypothetical protein
MNATTSSRPWCAPTRRLLALSATLSNWKSNFQFLPRLPPPSPHPLWQAHAEIAVTRMVLGLAAFTLEQPVERLSSCGQIYLSAR